MSELTLKVVVPSYDGEVPLTPAVLNALLSGISISLEGLAGAATIADGAVTTAKLADDAVTPPKLSASVAGTGMSLADATGLTVATSGVTPAKILYGAVNLGTSGTVALDWAAGLSFYANLTDNMTINFTGMKEGQSILVRIKQAAAGSKTLAWGSTILWRGAGTTAPTLTATANRADIFQIFYINTTFYGIASQNHYTP